MAGTTLQTIGTLLVGFVALRVHHRVIIRQMVDGQVLRTMKREQWFGLAGLLFIAVGYVLQLI